MTYIPTETRRLAQAAVRRTVRNDGIPGRVGLADGTVYFTEPDGTVKQWRVYVRVGTAGSDNGADVTVAYAHGVAVYYDMPVIVRNIDGLPYITTEDGQRAVWWSGDTVATPWHRHDRFSANPIYLEGLAFLPFLVTPTNPFSMAVGIQAGFYRYEGTAKNYAGETSSDLSSYVPSDSIFLHYIVFYLDRSDNTVKIQDGESINTTIQPAVTRSNILFTINELEEHDWPLAAVVFYNGQTQIVAQDIAFDCRLWALEYSVTGFDISALTEESGIDGEADWLAFYDTTAAANRKIHPADLPGGTGNVSLLWSQVEDVTDANTTDETTLLGSGRGSKTLPANTLAQGVTVRITGLGYISTTGAPTINLIASLGGTEVSSTGAQTLGGTVTDVSFRFAVDITCRSAGVSGTVVSSGFLTHDDGTEFIMLKKTATTVDTTGALAVDITATWSAAAAGNTVTLQIATIELLAVDGLALAAPSGLEATEV